MNNDLNINENNLDGSESWWQPGPKKALKQVADICSKGLSLVLEVTDDGASFYSVRREKDQRGILSVTGKLIDDSIISIRIELVRGHENLHVPSGPFFRHLSSLGNKIRILAPHQTSNGESSLQVELSVKASLLSMVRAVAFLDEIKKLDELARDLQDELPLAGPDPDLEKLYNDFKEGLRPVQPLQIDNTDNYDDYLSWGREILDYLSSGINAAIATPYSIDLDFAMALLANVFKGTGTTIGLVSLPAIPPKGIIELAQKAPGILAVSAVRISAGSNLYETSNEIHTMLSTLSDIGKPAIFIGTVEQLQTVFHGGQGSINDPLNPVVCHVPELRLDQLIKFSAGSATHISRKAVSALTERITSCIKDLNPSEQKRILPVLSRRMISDWSSGRSRNGSAEQLFISKICSLSETLAGLSPRPRAKRKPGVQEKFISALTSPGLPDYFREHLIAQDQALEQLTSRLMMEALTRPMHQPVRFCAQGTPGTGKSESAVLLAKRLDVPYVNIDAASMPTYSMAATQLLGSGRGYVNSYQSGRLEQIAKHHSGAVVEISDIDHAEPSVRAGLADIFLQVLETGEAQSAMGGVFSCANIIFAFTMNLPDGADEAVYKGIGFNNNPTRRDVRRRVATEIKTMLSGAFLSRIGTPIIFEPLDKAALSSLLEKTVKNAILSASERMCINAQDVLFENELGVKIIESLEANIITFGARAVLEHGRTLAANAFMEFIRKGDGIEKSSFHVTADAYGKVVIKVGGN
jgi:hypothetical protein